MSNDQQLADYIAAKKGQAVIMREGGSAYQLQTAAEIEARIARLESGEEVLPAGFFDEPAPIRAKRATTKRPKGNADKVDGPIAYQALNRANGDKQAAWSQYVILKSLRPGCDAKDFYAYLG